jgi:hypothetical protein
MGSESGLHWQSAPDTARALANDAWSGTHRDSTSIFILRVVHSVVGIALTFSKLQEKMAHETLPDLVWWYKCQHQLKLPRLRVMSGKQC